MIGVWISEFFGCYLNFAQVCISCWARLFVLCISCLLHLLLLVCSVFPYFLNLWRAEKKMWAFLYWNCLLLFLHISWSSQLAVSLSSTVLQVFSTECHNIFCPAVQLSLFNSIFEPIDCSLYLIHVWAKNPSSLYSSFQYFSLGGYPYFPSGALWIDITSCLWVVLDSSHVAMPDMRV